MSQYGIPYMGSKAKIAASIAANFPSADNFYDLFGGGFSMTHYVMERKASKYKQFHYNEINADIVDLVKKSISGDFSYDKFKPEWISREAFLKIKDSEAYVRCLWSFGNNQKSYLFGEDIEPYKKSMHMAVIFNEFDGLAKEVLGFDKWPPIANTITNKRFYLRQKIEFYRKTKIPRVLHQFLDSKQLQRLGRLQQLEQLERLQRLQRLEQLQQLKQLQQLQQLEMTAIDYRDVTIKPNSVVYCDIPYKGTASYLGEFNHKDFFDWAASRNHPVFISEYNIDDNRFKLVYSADKRSLLSAKGSNNIKSEKLYWNGVKL